MKHDHRTDKQKNEARRRRRERKTQSRRARQKELRRRQRRIGWRLRDRDWDDQPQPMFRGGNVDYELAQRARGLQAGGIGVFHELATRSGLVGSINQDLHLLKRKLPYWESDHVLNIAFNALLGGDCLEDIELRR